MALHNPFKDSHISKGFVGTVHSNSGLEYTLKNKGISFYRADVGDRNVFSLMKEKGIKWGGESSGHIIYSNYLNTGDGLFSALSVLKIMKQNHVKISELVNQISLWPSISLALEVDTKKPISQFENLQKYLRKVNSAYSEQARVLIRYSGTEPKIRILVEAIEEELKMIFSRTPKDLYQNIFNFCSLLLFLVLIKSNPMIEEIPVSKLDPRQVKQLEGAEKVLNSNPNYAKEIYSAVVKLSPGCLEVRRKLRSLQFRMTSKSNKGFSGIFGKVTAAPFMFGGKADKDPAQTLNKAEDLIDKSVSNVIAHQMLVGAARNLEMKGTVVFGLETIKQINPKDLNNLKELGNAYLETGDTEQAIAIGNEIQKINPSDGEAEDLMKRASVAVAMNKGKWEESEDFRTQLKDEAEAQSLEQASKAVNDAKGLEELIRQTYAKWEEEPRI